MMIVFRNTPLNSMDPAQVSFKKSQALSVIEFHAITHVADRRRTRVTPPNDSDASNVMVATTKK